MMLLTTLIRANCYTVKQKKRINVNVFLLQPFQTMVRGVSALRDDEKKEEKVNRPREPLTSLVDWAKSGGMEGFSLRGALRLPSFKVKAPLLYN